MNKKINWRELVFRIGSRGAFAWLKYTLTHPANDRNFKKAAGNVGIGVCQGVLDYAEARI